MINNWSYNYIHILYYVCIATNTIFYRAELKVLLFLMSELYTYIYVVAQLTYHTYVPMTYTLSVRSLYTRRNRATSRVDDTYCVHWMKRNLVESGQTHLPCLLSSTLTAAQLPMKEDTRTNLRLSPSLTMSRSRYV